MCALSSPTLKPVKQITLFIHPQPAATNRVSASQNPIYCLWLGLSQTRLSVTRCLAVVQEERKLLQPILCTLMFNYSTTFWYDNSRILLINLSQTDPVNQGPSVWLSLLCVWLQEVPVGGNRNIFTALKLKRKTFPVMQKNQGSWSRPLNFITNN